MPQSGLRAIIVLQVMAAVLVATALVTGALLAAYRSVSREAPTKRTEVQVAIDRLRVEHPALFDTDRGQPESIVTDSIYDLGNVSSGDSGTHAFAVFNKGTSI